MLTIEEIKNVSFRKAGFNGYRPEDVDAFIDEVIVSFEQLKKEKADLVRKMDILATRVEQYRADEETVRNALLASQKVADASIREAKEKSAQILREAEAKAHKLLTETNGVTAKEKDNYLQLKTDAVQLRDELKALYEKHLKTIGDLPTEVDLNREREELNKKYPTRVPIEEVDEPETEEPVQEVQPESVSKPQTEEAPADEKPRSDRHQKFDNLKFGDNYDVDED